MTGLSALTSPGNSMIEVHLQLGVHPSCWSQCLPVTLQPRPRGLGMPCWSLGAQCGMPSGGIGSRNSCVPLGLVTCAALVPLSLPLLLSEPQLFLLCACIPAPLR